LKVDISIESVNVRFYKYFSSKELKFYKTENAYPTGTGFQNLANVDKRKIR
jgi:hypothetical protein